MKLQAGYPVIHEFQGNRVDNVVDDLWETGSGGGKLDELYEDVCHSRHNLAGSVLV